MRWLLAELTVLAMLAAACAGRSPAGTPAPDPAVADRIALLAASAVEVDGAPGQADTLYSVDAEIIANGRRRTGSPRFAGVGERGRVVVGSTRVDVVGEFAWASLRYQWFSADENLITEGQATLVMLRGPGTASWRIVHAHSSQGR
ncbi:MAG: hypothetical protein OEW80_11690 [Gemmatimonadota bacterium]|nr:hypothetical protein [Gemmatimonadota bacterium]